MSTNPTANDEARTPRRPSQGGIDPGVAIVGFLICFVTGGALMWGFDAKHPHSAESISADTAGSVSKHVSADAVHVDLHVMAQCPYGVQAEGAFKDVVSKLGSDIDLNVEYIGQTTRGEPSSMHGPNEVKGDLLQVCAKKYAPDEGVRLHPLPERKQQRGRHERRGVRHEARRAGRQDHRLRRRPGREGPAPGVVQALAGQGRRREPDDLHRRKEVRGGPQAHRLHQGDLQRRPATRSRPAAQTSRSRPRSTSRS